ncbi:MAG: oxalate---CoA ligase [Acetobacteraceae bacterium]|nr:oxalate---CoA ligase [Acetobacteraceae bacterium]
MTNPTTMTALLAAGSPEAAAIGAPAQPPLSFQGLRTLAERTGAALNAAGVGRGDRVAIVLANGPEAASAFLAVACHAVTAPLNPAYRVEEFAFYLSDLKARALIVQHGAETPARAVAAEQGIPIIELVPDPPCAGAFTLAPASGMVGVPTLPGPAGADDVALVLHTSGTTARPKIVPLTHANLAASARHIGQTLRLGPSDICLNIMPLFHIHGLIAAVLSSVAAGGSVICTPGLSGFRFFTWLREIRPTWYTAVPTMHQALLDLAPRFKDVIAAGQLRFIRSSSASLPPAVMTALETTFGVPVIESYGMTEATHQMASNPLPPAPRFAGSVGIAAGPDVSIMDAAGTLLPKGSIGEVVIRGPNVTPGYESNPTANASAFHDGWFRTGDEGVLDDQGYLRLTGRLKEIINRAGEKITPIEVDNVLMEHPSVRQVVTFAMPSRTFGEDVAAAVVLHDGAEADPEILRAFVATRLAAFKVPRKIVFLEEIPKGATGKLQRIGLAQRLGVED